MHPLTLLLLALALHLANNASLSIYEQQKYKQFLEGQGLYSPNDDVVILTVHNFKTQVMNSPHAWFVEFYNSWCGFCQRFAPSWKALSTDVKGWADLVQIAALDCSVDENTPICREYEIMAYPTLRYFHEGYQPGPQNLGVAVQKGDDVGAHRRYLIERLVTEQRERRGAHYPNLLPYEHATLDNLFSGRGELIQYGFLVVEKFGGFIGAGVTLDLHKTPVIVRYAYDNNTVLLNKLGISTLPVVVSVDRNLHYQVTSAGSRDAVKSVIGQFLQKQNIKLSDDTPKQEIFTGKWLDVQVPDMSSLIQERAKQALKERIKSMGDVVFQMDLETALRYSLKHEIATTKTIEGEKLQVLRAYLTILRKYFPFGHGGQLFLTELAMKASGESVQGSELAEVISRAEAENSYVFSSPQQWLACRGSSPAFRGYPCGLWKLFHFLTVNSAEHNVNNRRADPLEVLSVMHGYVKNFFGCQDCSRHFQEMALKREMRNVSSLDSSVMWLWMAHNEVNKRLAGDQTEDPEYPKVQFPSKERCPTCRVNDNWELLEVLKYIKHMYSGINVRYIGSDTTLLHVGLDGGKAATSGSSSVFRQLDMTRLSEKAVRVRPVG
ncbi:sulfhydryl oxidase 2 [Tribolium castaneum]|uniref:Sulfhydryl oxidase n=1 Tax=Tribolium castaneum TaxID=7070 RepID=D6WHZ3_TRICA|nr:PREDICTED: sulfhydryl oxidase 2 [Tribolium castaneum]EEZ99710.2 Sulfhydryl oxidase 1-like Protein [Tribolium castaneum]|eukprot:XP_967329.1 PREDICTED: sulfhydryl oxidase 2 [Tribolium castaneum]